MDFDVEPISNIEKLPVIFFLLSEPAVGLLAQDVSTFFVTADVVGSCRSAVTFYVEPDK